MFLIPDRAHIPSYKSYVKDPSSKPPKQCILRALRTTEGKIVGNAFLLSAKEEKDGVEKEVNEIGYDLDVDYWGKGLGKFMVQFLVNWAGWVGLETIFAVSPIPF
jgi:RimJ/RimL family protein N-acetyltransferase